MKNKDLLPIWRLLPLASENKGIAYVTKTGIFKPTTKKELSATLDITWNAIDEAHSNLRALKGRLDTVERQNATLKKNLQKTQQQLKDSHLEQQLKAAMTITEAIQQYVTKSSTFKPTTAKELSATLDITQNTIAEVQYNMRALKRLLDAEEIQNVALKKELEKTQQQIKDSHALEQQLKAATADNTTIQQALEAEKAKTEQLQKQLAEALGSISERDANQAELSNILLSDINRLRQSISHIDTRLEDQITSIQASNHEGKSVVWLGCKDCPTCTLYTSHNMEKLAAQCPDQALEIIESQKPDALFTNMSTLGIDWFRDVRKRWPDLAIIVTTGCADGYPEDAAAIRSIATKVIPQPCGCEEVAAELRAVFLSTATSTDVETAKAGCTPTRPRLLVADDDEMVRKLLSTRLTQCGYDIVCMEDGVTALEAVTANDYDAVVTDIQMPRMDGVELTAKLKKLKPMLPIIVLSAAGDMHSSMKALHAGADCYVVKPANIDELSMAINRSIQVSRLEKEIHEHRAMTVRRTCELEKVLSELQKAAMLASTHIIPQQKSEGTVGNTVNILQDIEAMLGSDDLKEIAALSTKPYEYSPAETNNLSRF